jgi:hypothetical protein
MARRSEQQPYHQPRILIPDYPQAGQSTSATVVGSSTAVDSARKDSLSSLVGGHPSKPYQDNQEEHNLQFLDYGTSSKNNTLRGKRSSMMRGPDVGVSTCFH